MNCEQHWYVIDVSQHMHIAFAGRQLAKLVELCTYDPG